MSTATDDEQVRRRALDPNATTFLRGLVRANVHIGELQQSIRELTADRDALLARHERLVAALETFADLGQLVLDRITDGATNEERYLMKDTARLAMDRYRALVAEAGES